MEESCEHCRGLRGHETLRRALASPLTDEISKVVDEVAQLREMFRDACWYNFEVRRTRDWHYNYPYERNRIVCMQSRTVGKGSWGKHGVKFGTYYVGLAMHAPALPTDLILIEIARAEKTLLDVYNAASAAWDWAPGGRLYTEHIKSSKGALLYSEWENNHGGKEINARKKAAPS